jgi:hypothetical protein
VPPEDTDGGPSHLHSTSLGAIPSSMFAPSRTGSTHDGGTVEGGTVDGGFAGTSAGGDVPHMGDSVAELPSGVMEDLATMSLLSMDPAAAPQHVSPTVAAVDAKLRASVDGAGTSTATAGASIKVVWKRGKKHEVVHVRSVPPNTHTVRRVVLEVDPTVRCTVAVILDVKGACVCACVPPCVGLLCTCVRLSVRRRTRACVDVCASCCACVWRVFINCVCSRDCGVHAHTQATTWLRATTSCVATTTAVYSCTPSSTGR